MKSLDLSRIKVIGFIPNFNSKMSYPEFGSNTVKAVEPKRAIVIPVKEPKVLTGEQLANKLAIKKAKKAFNKTANSKRKPALLTVFKAV